MFKARSGQAFSLVDDQQLDSVPAFGIDQNSIRVKRCIASSMICFPKVSARGSLTGRRNIDELIPVFTAENDSHLAGPTIVSLKGPLALHATAARTKLG